MSHDPPVPPDEPGGTEGDGAAVSAGGTDAEGDGLGGGFKHPFGNAGGSTQTFVFRQQPPPALQ